MNMETMDAAAAGNLRRLLIDLARRQENLASDEAAVAPYWSSTPASVIAHRCAALALRAEADLLSAIR